MATEFCAHTTHIISFHSAAKQKVRRREAENVAGLPAKTFLVRLWPPFIAPILFALISHTYNPAEHFWNEHAGATERCEMCGGAQFIYFARAELLLGTCRVLIFLRGARRVKISVRWISMQCKHGRKINIALTLWQWMKALRLGGVFKQWPTLGILGKLPNLIRKIICLDSISTNGKILSAF